MKLRRLGPVAANSDTTALRPTREQAFEAFCVLLAFSMNSGSAWTLYDQRSGHLPPDARSADQFRRWHRAARRAGLPGVWTRGKLLLATADAWATPLATRRSEHVVLKETDDERLDAALGITKGSDSAASRRRAQRRGSDGGRA